MWNNKLKAITFSFDDGCQQDIRLIELLNKYNIKATFNLNSGLAGQEISFPMFGKMIYRYIVKLDEIKERYKGFEVASHSLHHPDLINLTDEEVLVEINDDQKNLENMLGYKVKGMIYPGGCYNEHIIELLQNKTNFLYSRTACFIPQDKEKFELPTNRFEWNQFYWAMPDYDYDKLIDEFLSSKPDHNIVLAIWGHSYELDAFDGLYEKWEALFKKIANRNDIFYGSNAEILDL